MVSRRDYRGHVIYHGHVKYHGRGRNLSVVVQDSLRNGRPGISARKRPGIETRWPMGEIRCAITH